MWKPRLYFAVAIIATVVIFIYAGIFLYRKSAKLNASTDQVELTYTVINLLNILESYLKDAETGQRGYLLMRDSTYLEPYVKFKDQIAPTYDSIVILTNDNPTQVINLKRLDRWIDIRLEYLERNLTWNQVGDSHFRQNFRLGMQAMDSCRSILEQMRKEETGLLSVRRVQQSNLEEETPSTFRNLLIGFILLIIGCFYFIYREFFRRIRYQEELQVRVNQLNQSGKELQQVAFAVSHNLQEPLRKIQVFCSRIFSKYKDQLPGNSALEIDRIEKSAQSAHHLLQDLSDFASSSIEDRDISEVKISDTIHKIIKEEQPLIRKLNARILVETDAVVQGYPLQLEMLFEELIDNALKFNKEGEPPVIRISSSVQRLRYKLGFEWNRRYTRITIEDNGIGFEQKYFEKAIQLFQQLHKSENPDSKGVGLALVQRVMVNHNGLIRVETAPGMGAKFHLFFPFRG